MELRMAGMSSTTRILAVTASARRFYLPQTQSLLLAAAVHSPADEKLEPTTGFSLRTITNPDADIAEDKVTTAAGSYNATCPNSPASPWVMQMATFRAAP